LTFATGESIKRRRNPQETALNDRLARDRDAESSTAERRPLVLNKLLYPTDFSEIAEKCIDYIETMGQHCTEEVIILHVIDRREINMVARAMSRYSTLVPVNVEKEMLAKTEEEIAKVAQRFRGKGIAVKTRIEVGIPFTEIVKVAEEEGASAIVIGSHGLSNIREMLLGSVSEKVIRKSPLPVLLVKR
jgi:nucleotide-binding universal stress UspA family protein